MVQFWRRLAKPSFHLVERTIAQLTEQGHPPHLSITITNRNAGGIVDAIRFALERNLTFSLNLFRDNDCAASFPDLQYEESAMIAALRDAFGVIEEFLPPWSVLGSVLDRGPARSAPAAVLRRRPGLSGHRPAWLGRQLPNGDREDPR